MQPGTVKRIRVVGLDYRAKGTVALGLHPWGGHQTSPCAINNGSYDVKHVLGTVDVEEDGSCCFECPSRVPVYFQMLDDTRPHGAEHAQLDDGPARRDRLRASAVTRTSAVPTWTATR